MRAQFTFSQKRRHDWWLLITIGTTAIIRQYFIVIRAVDPRRQKTVSRKNRIAARKSHGSVSRRHAQHGAPKPVKVSRWWWWWWPINRLMTAERGALAYQKVRFRWSHPIAAFRVNRRIYCEDAEKPRFFLIVRIYRSSFDNKLKVYVFVCLAWNIVFTCEGFRFWKCSRVYVFFILFGINVDVSICVIINNLFLINTLNSQKCSKDELRNDFISFFMTFLTSISIHWFSHFTSNRFFNNIFKWKKCASRMCNTYNTYAYVFKNYAQISKQF